MTDIPHIYDHTDDCPLCGSYSECQEYDSDEDIYVMICTENPRHRWYLTDDTDPWK
jgi:hypothetical protein